MSGGQEEAIFIVYCLLMSSPLNAFGQIRELFRYKLVKALLGREKITPRLIEIMQNWTHPGFSVFQGER
ncbi:MAG: hypothetical protein ABSH28_09940, partial [Acidobacteriota bacterium]